MFAFYAKNNVYTTSTILTCIFFCLDYTFTDNIIFHWVLFGLDKRITGFSGNSTLVILVSWHHDVAFHSPVGPPGIFDQPVVLAIIVSVSNDKNAMIELRAAAGSVTRTKIINVVSLVTQNQYLPVKWTYFLGSRDRPEIYMIWGVVQELLYDPLSLEVIADYQEKRYS